MDFELSRSQKEIQEAAKTFAKGEFDKELAQELDAKNKFPTKIWKKAGKLGFLGMHFPEKYSGQDLGLIDSVLVAEEFCRTDSTIGSSLILAGYAAECLLRYAGNKLKEKFLPSVAECRMRSSGAFSEPELGSNLSDISTKADKNGKDWVINGVKSNVFVSDKPGFYCVLCRTDPNKPSEEGMSLILVESDRVGVSRMDLGTTMGLRMISISNIVFDEVRVPLSNLIGIEGNGLSQVTTFLDESRIMISAQAVGVARGAMDRALEYVKQREQFATKIIQFQITRHKLADMATKIELSRYITYKAATDFDKGVLDSKLASMAKMFSTRSAVEVSDEAIQLFGGYGYMTEYDVERFYRDAKFLEIFSGNRDLQKDTIATSIAG